MVWALALYSASTEVPLAAAMALRVSPDLTV